MFPNWSLIVNCKTVNTECLIQLHYNLVTVLCLHLFIIALDYFLDWRCTHKPSPEKGEKKRLINNIQSEADPNYHPHSNKIREILFTLCLSPIRGGKD